MFELLLADSYLVFTFLKLSKIWGQIFPKENDHTHARQWQRKDWTPWAESEFWHDPTTLAAGVNFVAIPLKTAWELVIHLKAELNFILKSSSETWKDNRVWSTKDWAFFLIGMFSCLGMEKVNLKQKQHKLVLKQRSKKKRANSCLQLWVTHALSCSSLNAAENIPTGVKD